MVTIAAMYIEPVPNRKSRPTILLRESWREDGKVKKRTIANLTDWDPQLVEHFKVLLRGGVAVASINEILTTERSLPHGHVAAVLGTARICGIASFFDAAPARLNPVLLAMTVARVIEPASKLATWRSLNPETACYSLGAVLGLSDLSRDDMYRAIDWLAQNQGKIEQKLAKKHLTNGVLVLYDLTSTWLTGQCCDLAARGYSRDGKSDDLQIVYGLICTADGCPISVEVFSGDTSDSMTVAAQVEKLKKRFGLSQVVWVGDRGMLTSAKIETVLRPSGMSWITSLRAPEITKLVNEHGLQMSLFDERDLLEVTSEHYPGERLVVCRNPELARKRAIVREELLKATEKELDKIVAATLRDQTPLVGEDKIGLRVGKVIGKFKMAKHFELTIAEKSFSYKRLTKHIESEATQDGLYVIRTDVKKEAISTEKAVDAYKSLAHVERAFRSMKTVDLHVRPVFHWNSDRVRGHVFLCMLAYYVEWHMRQKLKPMLFDDEELAMQKDKRHSPVQPTERSDHAKSKDSSARTEDNLPVHSFRTLLNDLSTLCYNVMSQPVNPEAKIIGTTRPTPVQQKAFDLLAVNPGCTQ